MIKFKTFRPINFGQNLQRNRQSHFGKKCSAVWYWYYCFYRCHYRRVLATKQNSCVRSKFFAHSRDSAMSYFNLFVNPHIRKHLQVKWVLFIHKIKNDRTYIPAIFSGKLKIASEVHSFNIGFATNCNIYRPGISNNYGATTFSLLAPKIWESIPLE